MGSHQPRRHRYILIRKLTHWACVAYLLSIPSIFELDLHFVPNYTSAKFHACLSNGCNAIVLHFADSAEKKHNNTCQSILVLAGTYMLVHTTRTRFRTQLRKQTATMAERVIFTYHENLRWRKMSTYPHWMKIFLPNLVDSCITAMWRRADDRMNGHRNRKLIRVTSSGF